MPALSVLRKPGVHEKNIRALFGRRAAFRGTAPVFDTPLCLLAFSNRTGSNLLAEHLRRTPELAGFAETLNHPVVARQSTKAGVNSFPDYIRHLSDATPKPIYGFKSSWDQIMMLLRLGIDRMYPEVRVIHLTRQDSVAQAVSYLIAHQTERWTSQLTTGVPGRQASYDDALLRHLFTGAHEDAAAIEMICATFDLPRLTATYEELTSDPAALIHRIGPFLGLDFSQWTAQETVLQRQSGSQNAAFATEFKSRLRHYLL